MVLCLAVTGAILAHKMETVRAIFITIVSLITLHSTLFAVLKLLIASNIIDEEKVNIFIRKTNIKSNNLIAKIVSENSSINGEKIFTLNRKWMTHYVPYDKQ